MQLRLKPFRISRIDAFALRCPIDTPVATSFGIMRDRPAVFIRLEDMDGVFGWGESFANWPVAGAEHRVNVLMDDVADLLLRRNWSSVEQLTYELSAKTRIRAMQCGEPGPFNQVVAAIDIAAWDLAARRVGVPVVDLLLDDGNERANDVPISRIGPKLQVPAYASGLHIDQAPGLIEQARRIGFSAFKVKVGFDTELDIMKLKDVLSSLKVNERLFSDANQAWDLDSAEHFLSSFQSSRLGWVEEPIAADSPMSHWQRLATIEIPLAAGENIVGMQSFNDMGDSNGPLSVVQPDVAKWGGITGSLAVGRMAVAAGKSYCPHFLGGGVGLAASAHVLAAVGGKGLLEVDINPNPLRDAFAPIESRVNEGHWSLNTAPGLGIEGLPSEVEQMVTLHRKLCD